MLNTMLFFLFTLDWSWSCVGGRYELSMGCWLMGQVLFVIIAAVELL